MEDNKKSLDMTNGVPTKLLILFAIPILIGNIFQLLYNMVDTIVVGRYVSLDALAAIGATGSTTTFLLSVGQSMTNAVSIVISQAEGGKQSETLQKSVAHAVYLVLSSSLVIGLLAFFGARPLMSILGTPENFIDQSVLYIQITGGLTVATQCYNGVTSILRAIGDSRTPLYFLIFSSLCNVALDLLFVLKFHGGVAGVAFATVISQTVSVALCATYMLNRYPRLRPAGMAWKPDGKLFIEFLHIGMPMVIQNTALCVGMFVITAVINSHGSGVVTAYTIGSKIEQMAVVSFSSIATSFSVYSGQNFGAKLYRRIEEGVKKGLLVVSGLALFSTMMMLIFARPMVLIFMDEVNEAVLFDATSMVRIGSALYIALGAIWTVNYSLSGMGIVKITLISSIVELASKIGLSLILPIFFGTTGIWMASPIGWVLGLIPSGVYMMHWFRKQQPEGGKYIETKTN